MADSGLGIPPWLIPSQTAGDDYARLMHQSHQQKNEDARLGMEQQAFKTQQQNAAAKAMAQQQFNAALQQLDPKDPNYQKNVARLFIQFGPQLGMNGTALGGALKSFAPPPAPPVVTDLVPGGAGVPNPKAQPSPAFTGQLADILKGAGAPPVPPPQTGILPGSGKIVTDAQGHVHVIPPRPLPTVRPPATPAPRAIPQVPQGSTFNPSTNGAPAFFAVPTKPTASQTAVPRLSDVQVGLLSPQDQSNYVGSIAGATTNRLNKASAPAKPVPLPKDRSALVKGQPYTTARGVAIWDGDKFVQP